MIERTTNPKPSLPAMMPAHCNLLQRKCACGDTPGPSGECEVCARKKRLGVQTKLKINEPGDVYEQEADRIADRVMSTPAHLSVSGGLRHIQRFAEQSNGQTDSVLASVEQVFASPGRPLEPSLRQDMEQRFGCNFSRVRVHTDAGAEQSAQDVNANAYTVGHNIVFGAGRFAPGTHEGRRLIAHELAHVVQQSGAEVIRAGQSNEKRSLRPNSQRIEQPYSNRGVQGMPGVSVQRKPDDKTPATKAAKASESTPQKGMSRTLYVIHNDIWNELPPTVRANAEQELKSLFAFVGASSSEKPFSIKVVTAAELPEQFEFSESIVSVIRGDPDSYIKEAFARQNEQIRSWLAQQKVQMQQAKSEGKAFVTPERIGAGGGSRTLTSGQGKTYALLVAAAAVDIDEVIDSFFDNIEPLLADQLTTLPKRGRDPTKWPQTVKSKGGTTSWQPEELLGVALGRAIAHEARHEYIGAHAETGLGQDSPFIIGEKTTAQFSKKDQKEILDQIRKLEKIQGKATVVPTFPESVREKPEQFPF